MKKWNYYILPIFFLGFIYFMFLNQIFQWKTFEGTAENRNLSSFPTLDINRLDYFPPEYEEYLNDNFTFRKPFLDFYHDLKFKLKVSPNIENVLIGKNNFLFLAQRDQMTYQGKNAFTPKRLDTLNKIWTDRNHFFKEKQIKYYWLIAPNKHSIYPELLPFIHTSNAPNRSLILKDFFNPKFDNRLVYPLKEILNDKEKAFYVNDNHWTEKGGYLAYQVVMNRIQQDFPDLQILTDKDISWELKNRKGGGLADFLGKQNELEELEPIASINDFSAIQVENFNFKPVNGFPYPHEYEYHYQNDKALNQQKVLIIRDSFGSAMMKFLRESFSETVFIFDSWKYGLNLEIINKYQPDIVIYVTMESLVDNLFGYPAIIEQEP